MQWSASYFPLSSCFGGKFKTWRSWFCSPVGWYDNLFHLPTVSPKHMAQPPAAKGAAYSKGGWKQSVFLTGAVKAKHHTVRGFNHRHLFAYSSGDRESKIRIWTGWMLLRLFFLLTGNVFSLCLHVVFLPSVWARVLISSFLLVGQVLWAECSLKFRRQNSSPSSGNRW